jgi:ATP-dependent Clp protease, protease subunit
MHEIRIYDAIGGGGITAESIAASIPDGTSEITVRLNSPGGAVSDGLAIYNYLRDHKAKVTTIVDGYAASAASIVMLAGDVRQVHESSVVVVHNPWTIAAGDARDMRHNADVLEELRIALLDIYKDRTKMCESELAEMLDAETWMRGAVAVEYGFADEVIRYEEEEGKQAASVHFGRMLEIINGGNELMSKQYTRKEIEEQAAQKEAEAQAKITEAQAAVDVVRAEMQAQIESKEIEHRAAIESAEKNHAAQLEIVEQNHKAAIEEIKAKVAEANAKLESEAKARIEVQAKLDKANAALVNPAVADASLNNPVGLPNAAIDAEADAAEQAAQKSRQDSEPQNVAEMWESMEAGKDRQAFWNKNKREILSIISKR